LISLLVLTLTTPLEFLWGNMKRNNSEDPGESQHNTKTDLK